MKVTLDADSASTEPTFAVVTCGIGLPVERVCDTVRSVLAQTYDHWELIVVGGTHDEMRRALEECAGADPRIRLAAWEGDGIVPAVNAGLDAVRSDFVALVDAGDTLTASALAVVARFVASRPLADYLYSDEDALTPEGRREAFVKPAWSPERLRAQYYCGHLSLLRTDLVRDVGGFRTGFEGAHLHDLVLRVTEQARRVVHIPQVLYHRQSPLSLALPPDPDVLAAGRRAVQEHLDRQDVSGTVTVGAHGYFEIERPLPPERRVSIVIPTIGSGALIWGEHRCFVTGAVRSALATTDHENVEVVVVYDAPTPPDVLEELEEIAGDRLVLVPFLEPFNYSRKVNVGVLASTGDRIVLLNDDVEVRSPRWLEELVAPLEEPDVGMTGAKLYFSSTAIQHAGLAFTHGRFKHPYHRAPGDTKGAVGELVVNREVSGVTGACVAIRRELFLEVGGLCEELPDSFNDVDFSYKILRSGHRILLMARCELFHFETQTRVPLRDPREAEFIRDRWGIPSLDAFTPVYPGMPPPFEDSLS